MRCTTRFITGWVVALGILVAIPVLGLAYVNHRVVGHYFDSAGVQLHYTDEGSGEPVILVHGFAVNADLNFRHAGVTKALARTHRVIALDSRGHGLSGKPHDPAQYGAEMAHDVARLMDHLKLAKAHIVCYSLGGYVGLKFAALYPERCITLTAGASGWVPENKHGGLVHFHDMGKTFSADAGFRARAFARVLVLLHNDREALAAALLGCPGLQITEAELRGLKMPVLSIAGETDGLGRDIPTMKGLVADHRVKILHGASHYSAPTRPEFSAAIGEFIDQHAAQGKA